MDEDVRCVNCGWIGYAISLESKTNDLNDKDFKYCPDCGSDNIEDIEENE